MTDYELGYKHGFINCIKKYPNNLNYMEGFRDGNYARVYMPNYESPDYIGSNDITPDYY